MAMPTRPSFRPATPTRVTQLHLLRLPAGMWSWVFGDRSEVIVLDEAGSFGFAVVDVPPSVGPSPEAIVKFLVAQLVETGRLQPGAADRVVCQVLHRESLGSTGIGTGFALPHSKSDMVGEVLGIVGRSATPVHWPDAIDAQPVRVVCLLVTPAAEPGTSLRVLEAVARRMRGT